MSPNTIRGMEPLTRQVLQRKMGHFARITLENPVSLGVLCYCLIVVPIMGMWAVHKYNWQHWAPFDGTHTKTTPKPE